MSDENSYQVYGDGLRDYMHILTEEAASRRKNTPMTEDAERKLAAHQAFYAALADVEKSLAADPRPGSLAALDAALATERWRWAPSPTDFASCAEYDEAMKVYRQGPALPAAAA